jgi:hypothetical protein
MLRPISTTRMIRLVILLAFAIFCAVIAPGTLHALRREEFVPAVILVSVVVVTVRVLVGRNRRQ